MRWRRGDVCVFCVASVSGVSAVARVASVPAVVVHRPGHRLPRLPRLDREHRERPRLHLALVPPYVARARRERPRDGAHRSHEENLARKQCERFYPDRIEEELPPPRHQEGSLLVAPHVEVDERPIREEDVAARAEAETDADPPRLRRRPRAPPARIRGEHGRERLLVRGNARHASDAPIALLFFPSLFVDGAARSFLQREYLRLLPHLRPEIRHLVGARHRTLVPPSRAQQRHRIQVSEGGDPPP
mmetsp:Transcript_27622/g.90355  ORF Transcript_27622/g.90355 Transcript_27622/m.90355 type:complete len:246 (+) Transcript_27622:761-1498(+)